MAGAQNLLVSAQRGLAEGDRCLLGCTSGTSSVSVLKIRENQSHPCLQKGIEVRNLFHNATPAVLYEEALKNEAMSFITSTGALCVSSGMLTCTGASYQAVALPLQ